MVWFFFDICTFGAPALTFESRPCRVLLDPSYWATQLLAEVPPTSEWLLKGYTVLRFCAAN